MDPKTTPKPRDLTSPATDSRTGSGMRYIGNVSGCRPAISRKSHNTAEHPPVSRRSERGLRARMGAFRARLTVSSDITPALPWWLRAGYLKVGGVTMCCTGPERKG